MRNSLILVLNLAWGLCVFGQPAQADERQLLWGDTHLHTSYSFDAFLNGNRSADPDTAFRYAKGLPVIHPYHRARVQIGTPLDFLVVADHAEFYGGLRDIYLYGIQDPDPNVLERLVYWVREWQIRNAIDSGRGPEFFADQLPVSADPTVAARSWTDQQAVPGAELSASNAWSRLRATVDAHNDPGRFTSLIGWEWSSTPGGANLHRVIVTDADGVAAGQFVPFSSLLSPYPLDLWKWLDKTSLATGIDFVAIPHNSNLSKGFMFSATELNGEAVDENYARLRSRWERLAEATQIKGDSETHPSLSPEDEFADFEHYPFYLQQLPEVFRPTPADYIRGGLKNGLLLKQTLGINPFQFGLIGSTDSHTGLASAEEPNFWGKMAHDSIPENKQQDALAVGPTGWTMQAAGLAAVWADENTRSGIVGAMRRREAYATSGPRIGLRLFAGFDLTEPDLHRPDFAANGYASGVPMGGELMRDSQERSPLFLIHAHQDPRSAPLDRIQVVKGWLDADEVHEKVFDVAWSGERQPDAAGKLPAVGDTVDRSTATWTDDIGQASLEASWRDPEFNPDLAAFYYVRVLEIPTPRHALLDALALGMTAPTEGPQVIQERAYSSPVWYNP